jgi:hypothetical protein
MLRIATRTKLSRDEVFKRAKNYFLGLKMDQTAESPGCASFQGGGGGVSFSTTALDNGLTEIEFTSQEWDQQVRNFIDLLPQKVVEKPQRAWGEPPHQEPRPPYPGQKSAN